MSTPITASKYAIKHVGNPTTDAARLKSLDFDGPLVVASDHMLAVLLPEALESAASAGDKTITTHMMQAGLMEGYILDARTRKGGMHFSCKVDRCATLVKDLDEHGMDWTPILGGRGYSNRNRAYARLHAGDAKGQAWRHRA